MRKRSLSLSALVAFASVLLFSSVGLSKDIPWCHVSGSSEQNASSLPGENSPSTQAVSPSGDALLTDGTPVTLDGVKFRLIYRDGTAVGVELLRPDGSVVQPGEIVTLTDGSVIRLPLEGEPSIGVWHWTVCTGRMGF